MDFMGFCSQWSCGFFSLWWWWVSCGRCGGDGWLKERDSEEKIIRVMGGDERERLDLIILLGSIFYFNGLNRKIKVRMLGVVKWYDIIDKVTFKMVK